MMKPLRDVASIVCRTADADPAATRRPRRLGGRQHRLGAVAVADAPHAAGQEEVADPTGHSHDARLVQRTS